MNKRLFIVLCIFVLLSGCINKEAKEVFVTPIAPEVDNKFLYTAGTYRGQGNGFHGPIVVDVTVSESKILYIEIVSHDEANYLIDLYGNPIIMDDEVNDEETDETEDEPVEEEEIETEEVEVLGALDGVLNMILLEQKTDVDAVTHATVSCNGLKEAISKALAEAML